MHLDPEKYQYIFEKYLRNELGETELELLEEKLGTDTEFKSAFEYYKSHRAEILKRELEEYEEPILSAPKSKSINWLYLLVSIIGLVLVIDYYASDKQDNPLEHPKNFINKSIGFFKFNKKSNKSEKNTKLKNEQIESVSKALGDSSLIAESKGIDSNEVISAIAQAENQIQEIEELFQSDSLFECYQLNTWRAILESISYETDSILSDSLIVKKSTQLLVKKKQNKLPTIMVEYWQGANPTSAYKFDGNKISLYGISPSANFYILNNENPLNYYILSKQQLFPLINDNHIHSIQIQ